MRKVQEDQIAEATSIDVASEATWIHSVTMKLKRSRPEDAEECVRWMMDNLPLNDCSARTLKGSIFYKIDGVLYLPIKPVIMLESLAPNPRVIGKKRLLALRRAMDDLRSIYPGVEFIFLSRGNTRLDEAARYYGFKEEPYRVYRLIGGQEGRRKTRKESSRMAQASLRHHTGTVQGTNVVPAGHVPHLRTASREWRSEERPSGGSHQGNDNDQGHTPQSLQLGDWTCS